MYEDRKTSALPKTSVTSNKMKSKDLDATTVVTNNEDIDVTNVDMIEMVEGKGKRGENMHRQSITSVSAILNSKKVETEKIITI